MPAEGSTLQTPKRESYDVAVACGGLIGMACAWRAAERGLSVVVLERGRAAGAASSVAAGMLAPVTEADFGEQAVLRLGLASRDLWPAFAAELEERSGLPTHLAESGALVVAAERDDVGELRRLNELQRELGLEAEWLGPRDCRRLEPGLAPRIAGGVLAPRDAHVAPRAVAQALAAAFELAGGELIEDAEVAEVERDGDGVTGLRTVGGTRVRAKAVVIAAGPWSPALDPVGSGPPVRPVKGQLIELRARRGQPAPIERIVRTPRCYLVPRGDDRVVLGATVEEQGFDTAPTADGVYRLLEAAWEVVPEIGELELTEVRVGLRPGTPDNAPILGPGALEGLVWATGHYRNGVLDAPLTARAVAGLLAGEGWPGELRPFAPERFERVAA
jgi:glycine oxidase